jgi:transposase
LQGLSANWLFKHYSQSAGTEEEYWKLRGEIMLEMRSLELRMQEQEREIERLRAENRRLHQRGFKPSKSARQRSSTATAGKPVSPVTRKPRGAPKGHPPWNRKTPEDIDHHYHIEAPLFCPHCQGATLPECGGQTSYVQEDIVMVPKTVVSSFVHDTALCPHCQRQVIQTLDGELPFAPIGPNAKATALYLRHCLKLPYRKINGAMKTLFGLDFVPASTLGFEKRARPSAAAIHTDLIEKMRLSPVIHADETHWRENGNNVWIWYAGNESLAVFRIDAHRSSEAAIELLGKKIDGLLVTDAYASYNAIECGRGRQSCLAHLLRKSKEISEELASISHADSESVNFCQKLTTLFKDACQVAIPPGIKARKALTAKLLARLDRICKNPLAFPKAETLRKRLLPEAREYEQVFAFIVHDGPPTNNHAERSLRPMVIFRKVCLCTRSPTGSDNISIFGSLTQTAALHGSHPLEMFRALFKSSAAAQDVIFGHPAEGKPGS